MQCAFPVLYCDCLSYFSTLFHKEQYFVKKNIEYIYINLKFLSEAFLVLRRIQR